MRKDAVPMNIYPSATRLSGCEYRPPPPSTPVCVCDNRGGGHLRWLQFADFEGLSSAFSSTLRNTDTRRCPAQRRVACVVVRCGRQCRKINVKLAGHRSRRKGCRAPADRARRANNDLDSLPGRTRATSVDDLGGEGNITYFYSKSIVPR